MLNLIYYTNACRQKNIFEACCYYIYTQHYKRRLWKNWGYILKETPTGTTTNWRPQGYNRYSRICITSLEKREETWSAVEDIYKRLMFGEKTTAHMTAQHEFHAVAHGQSGIKEAEINTAMRLQPQVPCGRIVCLRDKIFQIGESW